MMYLQEILPVADPALIAVPLKGLFPLLPP